MKSIRTRYAPSPTGYMHIGNVKAALNEYLVAKSQGGTFVLRIEDTDQKREIPGAVEVIYKTLEILGIRHDEGPDVGGPFGPYIQSQRKSNYLELALELVKAKKAYYCFCDKERLETLVKDGANDAVKYDRHCLALSDEEIERLLQEKRPYVIRQLIPKGRTTFTDELFGTITVDNAELDDQILIKSDGFPTYNFANVIDDHAMQITHVVRGTEYLSSTPKYNLLYEAFGWEIPVYIHVPMICGEDGTKYSKRKGAPSIEDMVNKGFLPEAIVNFIALLGWSPSDNREFFTLEELIKAFDTKGLSKSPSVVDMKKLEWMNAEYFKRMDADEFYVRAKPVIDGALASAYREFDTKKLAESVRTRITFLSDIPAMIDFCSTLPEYEIALYENKKQKTNIQNSLDVLNMVRAYLAGLPIEKWNNDALYENLQAFAAEHKLKNSQVLWPVRVALSGKVTTPVGATELLELLGRDEALRRIDIGIKKLTLAV